MGRKPKWEEAQKRRFVTAWNYGVELEHIAERFDVDPATVSSVIRRFHKEGHCITREFKKCSMHRL